MTRVRIRSALVGAFIALVGVGNLPADDKPAQAPPPRLLTEQERMERKIQSLLEKMKRDQEAFREQLIREEEAYRTAQAEAEELLREAVRVYKAQRGRVLPQAPPPRSLTDREQMERRMSATQANYAVTIEQLNEAIREFKEQTENFKTQKQDATKTFEERLRREIEKYEKRRKEFERNEELEKQRGKVLPQAPPPRPVEKRTPGVRSTVEDVAGDLFVISIGSDAGLALGSTLNVYRTGKAGEEPVYLGKAKVTSTVNLFPKQAVVTFIPARDVPIKELKPAELPRRGDTVRFPARVTD